MKTNTNYNFVDALGVIQAKIAELEIEEKALKDALKASGPGAYEGDLFRATVSVADRETFDAKAAKEKLLEEGFHVFVKKHIRITPVTTVKVVSRNGEKVAA